MRWPTSVLAKASLRRRQSQQKKRSEDLVFAVGTPLSPPKTCSSIRGRGLGLHHVRRICVYHQCSDYVRRWCPKRWSPFGQFGSIRTRLEPPPLWLTCRSRPLPNRIICAQSLHQTTNFVCRSRRSLWSALLSTRRARRRSVLAHPRVLEALDFRMDSVDAKDDSVIMFVCAPV